MLKSDALSQLKQLKQDIKASRNLHTGIVKGTPNKFGFVTIDSGKDIFLPVDEMARVLPGDKVEIEVKKEPKNKVYGVLERLIDSPTKEFFGKYMTRGSAHFVVPDIAGLSQWFFIPPPKRKQAQANDYVRCKITQHPFKAGKAQAAVLEVIGNENNQGIEWDYSIHKHGLSCEWSEDIQSEVQQLLAIDAISDSDRKDLTPLPFVTIDSESAQDLDDALYAEKSESGWNLKVAIADPASFIKEGGAIYKELVKRATSVYFPGQVIPMLPSEVSTGHCSLVPQEVRRAKVVDLSISEDGRIISTDICNGLVKSGSKLSYGQATEFLQSSSVQEPFGKSLNFLAEIANAVDNWRKKNALVGPSREEFHLVIDEHKKVKTIEPRQHTLAHHIVETCMIACNLAVARFIESNAPSSVFVTHSGVREDRIESISKVLKDKTGEDIDLSNLDEFKAISQSLLKEESADRSYFSLISRQQERARLSNEARPHFAMGLECYATFTSPLRKASDFLLHKQIDHYLKTNEWQPTLNEQLEAIDDQLQVARNANYDLEQWLKCQYLNKSKEVFEASVFRVFASGCQIRLTSNGIEGFIPARELSGKFSYDQDLMTLKGQEYSFELDQTISVSLKMIDWKRKQLLFLPAS